MAYFSRRFGGGTVVAPGARIMRIASARLLALVVAVPVAALAACGGSVVTIDPTATNTDGGAEGGSVDGGPDATAGLGVEGSYDVTFSEVTATVAGPGPTPPPGGAPSMAKKSRLDIRKNPAGGYEAVFTSRWGTSAKLAASVSDTTVLLTGRAGVSGGNGFYDSWSKLTLPRDANGKLTGQIAAEGEQTISQGDVVWTATLTGKAFLARDFTAPELAARLVSNVGPADALLPWDKITVDAAEPVPGDGLRATRLVPSKPGEKAIIPKWIDSDASPAWSGETSVTGRVADWAGLAGGGELTVENDGKATVDLVGLPSPPLRAKVKFHPLPSPTAAIDFDGDVVMASTWGPGALYGGGITGGSDPRCEAIGCARIGPVKASVCNGERAGLAGMINVGPLNRVALRYRVVAEPELGAGQPFVYGDVLTMELARVVGSVSSESVIGGQIKLQKLAQPIDGMTWATEWTTLEVSAPAGSDAVGVAVAAGGPVALRGGCGGPPPPPVKMEILVERVAGR